MFCKSRCSFPMRVCNQTSKMQDLIIILKTQSWRDTFGQREVSSLFFILHGYKELCISRRLRWPDLLWGQGISSTCHLIGGRAVSAIMMARCGHEYELRHAAGAQVCWYGTESTAEIQVLHSWSLLQSNLQYWMGKVNFSTLFQDVPLSDWALYSYLCAFVHQVSLPKRI